MNAITTRLSSKGQLVLPKALRDKYGWDIGTSLVLEDTANGVIVRAAPAFPPSRLEDVIGGLKHDGQPLTLEEMDQAITDEAEDWHARD